MSHVPQLLLFLALAVAVAKVAGHFSARCGRPELLGQVLAGLLLGPSLLNILGWAIFAGRGEGFVHYPELGPFVQDLAEIGAILLMFVAGLEVDPAGMRAAGPVPFRVALGGALCCLLSGAMMARSFGYGWSEGFFAGAALTATGLGLSARALQDRDGLPPKEVEAVLRAAPLAEVMSLCALALVVAFAGLETISTDPPGGGPARIAWPAAKVLLRTALFFALVWIVGGRGCRRLMPHLAPLRVREPLLAFALVALFGTAWAAESLGGMAGIVGAYMIGSLFAGSRFKEGLERGLRPLAASLFAPIVFVNLGLQIDLTRLGSRAWTTLVLIAVALLGKFAGCGLSARAVRFGAREAYRAAAGMIPCGEIGLIAAAYGLAHGLVQDDLFCSLVLMMLVTMTIAPVWTRVALTGASLQGAAPKLSAPAGDRDRETAPS